MGSRLRDEARILREEIARTRQCFLRFADAQHSLAAEARFRGDEQAMEERCAIRDTYRRSARILSDMLARVTRRMRDEVPNAMSTNGPADAFNDMPKEVPLCVSCGKRKANCDGC